MKLGSHLKCIVMEVANRIASEEKGKRSVRSCKPLRDEVLGDSASQA